MKDSIKWRLILVLAITVLSAFFFFFDTKTGKFSPNGTLKQGLDLKGGVHLVLLMDPDPAVYNRVQTDVRAMEGALKNKNVPYDRVYTTRDALNALFVEGKDPNLGLAVRDVTDKTLQQYSFSALGDGRYKLELKRAEEQDLRDKAILQSVEVIRNRIDKYGVSETAIHRQGLGSNKIVVELPGVEDSTEIKALIGKAAQLEWHLGVEPKQGAPTREAVAQQYGGKLPEDVAIYPGSREKFGSELYFALKTTAVVTGGDLQEVRVEGNQYGQPVVGFQLSATAGQRFKEFTRAHIHEPLVIVLDGNVISAPVINAEIGDRGIIEGNFTQQEAQELVFQLKSGALPAIPRFAEERTVGPSLGLASIRKGTVSGVLGLLAIFAFMLLYYRASGINANACLLLNFVILMGFMSTFGLTLTVPGIAGIILMLGMAIDANVLIFERIKDELIDKKTIQAAIQNGFGKAFITIFDSNVTTLVSALFLLQFGTGPVRGFAVTLTVGLIVSMFTAIFVSRLVYDIVLKWRARNGERPTTLSIGPLHSFRGTTIKFMSYKWQFVGVSLLIIGIGMWSLFTRGINWGIDFRGGQEIQVRFAGKVDPRAVEKELSRATSGTLTVVQYGKPEENEILIRTDAKDEKGNLLSEDALALKNQQVFKGLRSPEILAAIQGGKVDLNTSNAKTIEDLILQGVQSGAISGSAENARTMAQGIQDYKKEHGGILASMDALRQVAGMSDAMVRYLQGKAVTGNFAVQRIETVGPTVGKELQSKALQAVIGSLIGILLYCWFRFQFRFSVGAVLSLIHDTAMAIGFVSLFRVEVNLPTVAALLTLLGYSINDTIVVFDRIREHMKLTRKQEDDELFNLAMNETLSRTMITSLLTFFVVVAMLIWGGDVLFSFSFVMTVGIIVGTYSSIFVASPYVLWWNKLGLQKYFSSSKKRR
jgi:preprotein translocase subunit SecD